MPTDSAAIFVSAGADELSTAVEAAIERAQIGIAAMLSGTLDDLALLEAFDEARAQLGDAAARVHLVAHVHPDPDVRAAAQEAEQKVRSELVGIDLNSEVYRLLATVDSSGADSTVRHYLVRVLRDFRRAGVDRDDATRTRIRALQEELAGHEQEFLHTISSDVRTAVVAAGSLAGMPPDYLQTHPADGGQVRITTAYPDIQPLLTYCRDGAVREQLWRLFRQRGYPANGATLRAILQHRHELATLLGYQSWAQYAAEDKMIGSAERIREFIGEVTDVAMRVSAREYARLLDLKRRHDPAADAVYPWDELYLLDQLKAEELDFDTQAMRAYLPYDRVKAGVMALTSRLFGLRFRPQPSVPVWHPDVECHEVFDGDQLIGRIFLDMHPRAGKFPHAAMFPMTTGKAGIRVPEAALVCNLPRPGGGPGLLLLSDVRTFLHEFGHLVHHVCASSTRWAGVNGLAVEWDFVEAPSKLLEEWLNDAALLSSFAVHHRTGDPLPAELIRAMAAAEDAGKGLRVCNQVFYAVLSFALHEREPDGLDPLAVERAVQERYTPYRHVEGTYAHLSFGHLVEYSALYCSYLWSAAIAKDLFTLFAAADGTVAEVAARYRDVVLVPGGAAPAAELIAKFLGRPATFDAYRDWLDSS